MERKIAIDAGKYATKAVMLGDNGEIHKIVFRTKMDLSNAGSVVNKQTSSIVDYKGKRYLIGDEAETSSYTTSKTEEIHKIAIYTAIAKLCSSGDTINAAIGMPVSTCQTSDLVNDYRRYIMSADDIDITVDGLTKHFKITKLTVLPESSGVIVSHINDYMGRTIGVIDLGGLNVNGCVYRNLAPVISTNFTANLGSNVMTANIKNKLESIYGMTLQDYIMDDIMRNGTLKGHLESHKLIADEKRAHVDKIKAECTKKQWPLDAMDLVFVGGTSLYLKDEIKEIFNGVDDQCFAADAQFANVFGFLAALG